MSVVARVMALTIMLLMTCACGRSARQAAEPIAVSDGNQQQQDAPVPGDDSAPEDSAPEDSTPEDSTPEDADKAAPGDTGAGGASQGGGLWVVDAAGAPVGWLVQRGHPFQAQDGQVDILRDGVLVYAPSEQVFFGIEMTSAKILVPRLGISDPQCTKPSVAGYYAQGDQISGMAYAFTYNGKWWRIQGGQPTALVQCAGVTKQGATPTCVLHSGTCRGFPVEVLPSPKLPVAFKAPLHFAFGLNP